MITNSQSNHSCHKPVLVRKLRCFLAAEKKRKEKRRKMMTDEMRQMMKIGLKLVNGDDNDKVENVYGIFRRGRDLECGTCQHHMYP